VTDNCIAVIDIGKTNAKLSLWDAGGGLIDRCSRANETPSGPGRGRAYRTLDADGIDGWLMQTLREYAKRGRIRRIVPVGHGAAAALVRDGALFAPPMDYEDAVPDDQRAAYSAQRDPFAATGSPELPQGLNLGIQLHRLEQLMGPLPEDVTILPWPQYWAWRLCGVPASEVSSLGCHTDLWRPFEDRFSDLAVRRGWAERIAPVRPAALALGTLLPEIARRTGLPEDCQVHCGLHDSNAALVAALGHTEIAGQDATVLSTGTWFVAMRSLAPGARLARNEMEAGRDCLVNVDVHGRPVPSARFMGGREAERIGNYSSFDIKADYDPDAQFRRLPELVASGACAYPSFVPGVGPFPAAAGGWHLRPDDAIGQRALASLYLALMADSSLSLIGSRDCLLVEGRFAEDLVFVRALAALRPEQGVFVTNAEHDVAFGALRLVNPELPPGCELSAVKPLDIDLRKYAAEWRAHTGATGQDTPLNHANQPLDTI